MWPIRRFRWQEDSLSSVMKGGVKIPASERAYLEEPWKSLVERVVLGKYIQNGIWVSEATMKRRRKEEEAGRRKSDYSQVWSTLQISQTSLPSFMCFRETIQKTNY